MKKFQKNNKGFSLVELIVVMAIMAVLAVTLAPKLTHYIEKARQASDKEVINTILSATMLSLADDNILTDYIALAEEEGEEGEETVKYVVDLSTERVEGEKNNIYSATDKKWEINNDNFTDKNNKFFTEMSAVVGDFNLKSASAITGTKITITVDTENNVTVELNYDGNGDPDYTISSN